MDIKPGLEKWWENTDALKANRKLIKSRLRDCLKANGYRQGRCSSFYLFSDDAAVYYMPEHPSIMTYLWLCFYPLWMPPGDLRIFSFGARLSTLTEHYVWNIRDYESEASVDEWCRRITEIDGTRVAPLIREISTAEAVDRLCGGRLPEAGAAIRIAGFMPLGAEQAIQLAMFAKLALHEYDGARALAEAALKADADGRLRMFTAMLREHCRLVTELASAKDSGAVDATIDGWREANRRRFPR